MGRGHLASLAELSVRVRAKQPAAEPSEILRAAFRLPAGSLTARREDRTLVLASSDKTVRFALQGMEEELLRHLAARGHSDLRGVRWSAA